jgi:hypothetical protein
MRPTHEAARRRWRKKKRDKKVRRRNMRQLQQDVGRLQRDNRGLFWAVGCLFASQLFLGAAVLWGLL